MEEDLPQAQYDKLKPGKATAWWEWSNAFDQRVLKTAQAWANEGDTKEGIRQAANIIVRLLYPILPRKYCILWLTISHLSLLQRHRRSNRRW